MPSRPDSRPRLRTLYAGEPGSPPGSSPGDRSDPARSADARGWTPSGDDGDGGGRSSPGAPVRPFPAGPATVGGTAPVTLGRPEVRLTGSVPPAVVDEPEAPGARAADPAVEAGRHRRPEPPGVFWAEDHLDAGPSSQDVHHTSVIPAAVVDASRLVDAPDLPDDGPAGFENAAGSWGPARFGDPARFEDPAGFDGPGRSGAPARSPDPGPSGRGARRRPLAGDGPGGAVDPVAPPSVADRGGPIDEEDPAPTRWRARRIRRGTWGRLAEKWVPEPVREARVDPGRRGAVVFVAVALVAGLAAAVAVWTTGPSPQPVAATVLAPVTDPAVASSPVRDGDVRTEGAAPDQVASDPDGSDPDASGVPSRSPAPSGSAAVAAVPADVVVSVTGRVSAPGLVTLPPGARVSDAITAAGGPAADADLTGLNLATRLSDGDSVVVGAAGEGAASRLAPGSPPSPAGGASAGGGSASAGGAGGGTGLLDLNTADQTALEGLPGVGPVMAGAILAWRTDHGPFTDVGQLQEVSGIGPARYAQLQPLVTV